MIASPINTKNGILRTSTSEGSILRFGERCCRTDLRCIKNTQVRHAAENAAPSTGRHPPALVRAFHLIKKLFFDNYGEVAPPFRGDAVHPRI